MSEQRQVRHIFSRIACFFTVLAVTLAFSACPDPITALDDIALVESPEMNPSSPGNPEVPPENPETPPEEPPPASSASVKVTDAAGLKEALANQDVTAIEVGAGLSLTIDNSIVMGTDKSLTIPSSSMVTIHNLLVPAGSALSLNKGEGNYSSQVVLDSLYISGELSVNNIQITLNKDSQANTVTGKFNLYSGTVIVNSGGNIKGSGIGEINITPGVRIVVDTGDNNFYKKEGLSMNPPTGNFLWDSGKACWVENITNYPETLEKFFAATYSTKYVFTGGESLPGSSFIAAADGEKTLVLNSALAGDSLTLDDNARLKLEGLGSLNSKTITLGESAVLEVATGVTFYANEGRASVLQRGSSIVVSGIFYNTMPGWDMENGAEFVFHAGSKIYKRETASNFTQFIGKEGDGSTAKITLKSGNIVLCPSQFRLDGNAVLNEDFSQVSDLWAGGVYIKGTLEVNKKFTIEQSGNSSASTYFFELADTARVTVRGNGSLVAKGPSAGRSSENAKLGANSSIVVEDGGSFYNYIFPNWEHGGTGAGQGAFIFKKGSQIYAPGTIFGGSNSSDVRYIGESSAVVELKYGQIRLTEKTFTLEDPSYNQGHAVLKNSDFKLSGSKLVIKNSTLEIEKGFTVENTSATEEFVTLANAKIVVKSGGKFAITGPDPLPPGDIYKLAALSSSSSITVKAGGEFHNGIYPNWQMDNSSKFVFESGSSVYVSTNSKGTGQIIGGSNQSIDLKSGTITYAHEKITLNGKADVDGETIRLLWSGFELIVETNSTLTVHIGTGFTLEGITVIQKPGAKIEYTS